MLYKGQISLHFDPPIRHSHRTRSLLLWALIRILYLDTRQTVSSMATKRQSIDCREKEAVAKATKHQSAEYREKEAQAKATKRQSAE